MKWLSYLFAFEILCAGVAPAAQTLRAITFNRAAAPVVIDSCTSDTTDTDVGNIDYYLNFHATYHNRTTRQIQAIRLGFILEDAFDAVLTQKGGIDGDGLRPTASGNGDWQFIAFPETTQTIKCYVRTVKFADGKTYSFELKK